MNSAENPGTASGEEQQQEKRHGAFYVWFHPSRTSKILAGLQDSLDGLRNLLERSEHQRRLLAEENAQLTSRLRLAKEQAERDNSRSKSEIARLERNSDSLQREIEEWRRTQTELEELASTVEEWDKMKNNYEKQIKELNLRLNDALGNFRGAQSAPKKIDVSDILDDTDSPYADPTPRRPRHHRQTPPADDTDWLLSLPE